MPATISLARGAPASEALDAELIAACTQAALARDGARLLSYGAGGGYAPLREHLAAELGAGPEELVITNGSLQGFVFLVETHLRPGDLVAVEAPTYDRVLLQLERHGMDVLPIPVEADGLDVEALAAACAVGRVPRLLYTIPNFQNPSGATLSHEKRIALAALAEREGVLVLEDDPYGLLRFEGESLPRLYDLAAPGGVIFTSSFSKTIAPGLRVGYMAAPAPIAAELAAAASRTYISPSLPPQGAVHELLTTGRFPANVARVTELMRQRRDAMLAGLSEMPAGTACNPPAGGFFCWLTLPRDISADELEPRAAEAGVTYVRGSTCFVSGGENTLRLAYSGAGLEEIVEGMRRLGAVLQTADAPTRR